MEEVAELRVGVIPCLEIERVVGERERKRERERERRGGREK